MDTLQLKIITPKKIAKQETVESVTVPTVDGEITILPHHVNLFSLLKEGIVKVKNGSKEEYLAIGGGYLQTDGAKVVVLVSKAYHQDEIDESLIEKAVADAKKIISTTKDESERSEALATLRHAVINSKLLKKRKPKSI